METIPPLVTVAITILVPFIHGLNVGIAGRVYRGDSHSPTVFSQLHTLGVGGVHDTGITILRCSTHL